MQWGVHPVSTGGMASACSIIDTLAQFQQNALNGLNRKFAALKRLAKLLEQLGDISKAIPDISKLVPVANIDLSTYKAIAAACPALSLPSAGDASISALQSAVKSAYSGLVKQLQGSSWLRMSSLQGDLQKFSNKVSVNFSAATGNNYAQCLLSACSSAASTSAGTSASQVQATTDAYNSGYAASNGQVLTTEQQAKVTKVTTAIAALRALGATVSDSYATLTKPLTTPPPLVLTESAGTLYTKPPFGTPNFPTFSSPTQGLIA